MKKDKKKCKKTKKEPRLFKNVRKEMREVKWPNKKEMFKYSFAVLACIIVLSLFFTASDIIISGVKTVLGGL